MITKERVFVVSSNVDDSIRNTSVYSDVKIFRTFKEFEDYVDKTPIDASMIIVNSKDLHFTNSSMTRLLNILTSTFVSLSGLLYYMVDDQEVKAMVDDLCKRSSYDKIKCLYSPTLHAKDVADVLSGESLSSKETVTEIKTYRVRAADYIRSQKDKENVVYEEQYHGDEDQLSGIPNEPVPEDLRATNVRKAQRHTICSNNLRERSVWVTLKAQYLSLNGKVLVLERDIDYHTLYDMLSKIEIDFEFFDISNIFRDCSDVINQIKGSKSKLIFVGSKHRINYSYDILMSILISNLESHIDHYIYEAELGQIPYGSKVDVVMPTNVPEIFKSINAMSSISSFKDILFIGLDITNLGIVSISESEFTILLKEILQENNINSVVIKTRGLLLRKEIGLGGVFMHN
jgi:hypothetical protein